MIGPSSLEQAFTPTTHTEAEPSKQFLLYPNKGRRTASGSALRLPLHLPPDCTVGGCICDRIFLTSVGTQPRGPLGSPSEALVVPSCFKLQRCQTQAQAASSMPSSPTSQVSTRPALSDYGSCYAYDHASSTASSTESSSLFLGGRCAHRWHAGVTNP